MSEVHEQEAARAPRVGVHALATAAAGALPVPGLDRYLRALTRGAALRRVASRRGVRLTPDARSHTPAHSRCRCAVYRLTTRRALSRL